MNTPPSTPAHSSAPFNRLEMPPPPPGPLNILYSTFEVLVKQLNPVKSGVKGLDIRKDLSKISEKDWIQFGSLEITQRAGSGQPDSVARSDLNEIVYQTKVILERRQWKPFKDAVASLPTFQKHEAPTILKIALSKLTFDDFTQLCRSGDPGSPMPRTLIGRIIRVTQSVNADTTLRKSPKPPIERIRQANYFIVHSLNKIGIHCRTVLGDRWVHIWQASTREVQDYNHYKSAVFSIPNLEGHGFSALLRRALLGISLNNFSEIYALRSKQLTSLVILIKVAAASVTEVIKAVTLEGNSVDTLASLNETMDRDLLNVDALCMVIFGPRVWVPVRRTTADSDSTMLPSSQKSLGHSRLAFRPMRRTVTGFGL
ncbi:hypothetical protein JCM3765_007610 [Sporobolomyces pararoseus]